MGYQFKGFFVSCSDEQKEKIVESVNKKWPEIKCKVIYDPFLGIGGRVPDLADESYGKIFAGQKDQLPEKTYDVGDLLPSWSVQFPEIMFVYLEADCFGGNCLYGGYVCKNNEMNIKTKTSDKDSLGKLLSPLGIKLNKDNYFKPLERGYFD